MNHINKEVSMNIICLTVKDDWKNTLTLCFEEILKLLQPAALLGS